MSAWSKLGLRGRLAISIAAIVVFAFGAVFVVVRAQMANESAVIRREEAKEPGDASRESRDPTSPRSPTLSPTSKRPSSSSAPPACSPPCSPAICWRRARRLRCDASPIPPPRSTRATSRPGWSRARRSASELRTVADAFNHMLDRLEDAFARQRRFVSDASHELRSPLTAIRGQLEVLARSEAPDAAEVRRVEALALAEMGRVERLVEDLLALARLDEGVGPAPRELAADSFLRELITATDERVEIGALAAGTLRADPDLIAQVLRNLIENARRHAGPSGQVSASSAAVQGGLRVDVDDDGPGVSPAERERVFDRFHRSEAARERAAGGSGLGLGIARSILASHDGRIWIEGSPLGGARVSFELPAFTPTIRDFSANS